MSVSRVHVLDHLTTPCWQSEKEEWANRYPSAWMNAQLCQAALGSQGCCFHYFYSSTTSIWALLLPLLWQRSLLMTQDVMLSPPCYVKLCPHLWCCADLASSLHRTHQAPYKHGDGLFVVRSIPSAWHRAWPTGGTQWIDTSYELTAERKAFCPNFLASTFGSHRNIYIPVSMCPCMHVCFG